MLPDLSGTHGKSFILPHMDLKKKQKKPQNIFHHFTRSCEREKRTNIYIQSVQVLTLQTTLCLACSSVGSGQVRCACL